VGRLNREGGCQNVYSWFARSWGMVSRIFAVLLLSTTLTGCWDSSEIDELAIVLESGVDVANSSSGSAEGASVLGSVQIAVPMRLGATTGGGPAPSAEEPFLVESATGKDPAEIIDNLRKK
jgi:spore germination protein KC